MLFYFNLYRRSFKWIALILSMLFLFNEQLCAQQQDSVLREIRVKRRRIRPAVSADERINDFTSGLKVTTLDSTILQQYAMQNLGNLLSQQVPVFVKSYGVNSLATLNFRGSSSAQSQVYWNGIPLNNASLGMTDVSLLNVAAFDKINIVYGSSSALLGSGNVGAALMLESGKPVFTQGGDLHRSDIAFETGSFGQYKVLLHHKYTSRRWSIDARWSGQLAENNFNYNDRDGHSTTMDNAAMNGISGTLSASYRLDSSSTIGVSLWWQRYNREVPPALFESGSRKDQRNESFRAMAEWRQVLDRYNTLYLKAAYIEDGMNYEDPDILLQSSNVTAQYYHEAGWKHVFNKHHELLVFLPFNSSWVHTTIDSIRSQDKIAVAAAYRYAAYHEKLQISLNARAERINQLGILLPGVNMSYDIFRWLRIRANVQRTFRAPTLNEWYYVPGGNSDLKPEEGWNADGGYRARVALSDDLALTHDLSVFNRNIHNWIIWLGGAIWTPHNIASVYSRGVETENVLYLNTGMLKWHLGCNTSYVLATTTDSYITGDNSIGKQIPYSPRFNGQGNIGFQVRDLYFNYNHTYTSARFITVDESQYLDAYQTGNAYLSYSFSIKKYRFRLYAQCNNVWDVHYQVVNQRPMPGRNWLAGFGLMF